MSATDLEALLRESFSGHAEGLADTGLADRGARAREQASGIRRRRTLSTAVVVLVATALAVGGMLGANPFERPDAVDQPQHLVDVPAEVAGRTLLESGETTDGRILDLAVTSEAGTQWMLTCAGVGPAYELHHTLDDVEGPAEPCAVDPTFGDTGSFRLDADEPAGPRTLRVWLTEAGSDHPVETTGAVLSAAVFALPDPLVELAGSDVLPLERSLGIDWSVVTYGEGEPGARSFTLEVDHRSQTMLELIGTGSGDARVRAVVDAQPIWGESRPLDNRKLGDLLGPGRHTVTLEVVGEVPSDARLAIVQRERA